MIDAARTRVVTAGACVMHYDKVLDAQLAPLLAQTLSGEFSQAEDQLSDPTCWFDPNNPELNAQPVQAGGRAAAWFIEIGNQQGVLRQYRRGGLAAKFLRDQYLWTGYASSRAFAEFSLMQALWLKGLPVPQPLAAAVWRKGLTYRAALITARVQSAKPLALVAEPQVWAEAGRVIAKMHHAGVWHADLNVFNLLVDSNLSVWLIDFDRARSGLLSAGQCEENLNRLLRSVRKVIPELEQACWPVLSKAYVMQEQTLSKIGKQ